MKVPAGIGDYAFISDNTQEADSETLFLETAQNAPYRESLSPSQRRISPRELMKAWGIDEMRVVGVTGTNGKTTVTALIYSLLVDLDIGVALQGTRGLFVNDERLEEHTMTTPSILHTLYNMKRARESGADCFVMEVSSHAIDQDRIEGLDFALKVHTNVTGDHLDYHGSIEEYRRVKSRFFSDDSLKLINRDDSGKIEFDPRNAYTYGVDEPASFKVDAYSLDGGISAIVRHGDERSGFFSNMMGLFNLYNIVAAVASVKLLTHRPFDDICDAVENFGGVAGRMEIVSRDPLVIVDFAHTHDGMYRVMDSLKERDLVVVFGAGGDRDRQKRPKMGAVAGRFAKKIYVTSDNPRSEKPEAIISEILSGLEGKENVKAIADRREAIETALSELQKGEILLILGKGDEDYQEIDGVRHPFDDREVVRDILSEKELSKPDS